GTIAGPAAFAPASSPDFIFPQLRQPFEDDGGWVVVGSVTTASRQASAAARAAVEEAAARLVARGVEVDVGYDERWIAGVTNDPELTRRASASARTVLGEGSLVDTGPVVPAFSEDFGSFQETTPGVMFFLGVSNAAEGIVGMPHSPGYVADEGSILVGARGVGAAILDLLAAGG
ncbi:MAG: hypothetical protein R3190_04185, partial [Thermoanaerobaculia bacterium]|nr:hypothetical protein [Thermoanaerobaculia bacterium]